MTTTALPRSLTNPPDLLVDLLIDAADTFGRVTPMLPLDLGVSIVTYGWTEHISPLHKQWRDLLLQTARGDNADFLTGRLLDVRMAWWNLQQREASGGTDHLSCCSGECGCVDRAICDDCADKPHALLHDAVRELLILIGRTCGESRVVETYGLAV